MLPTLLHIGPFTIRTYGLFVAIGIFAGLRYMLYAAKKNNIPGNKVLDLVLYAVAAGIIGARLAYVLTSLPYYAQHPVEIFKLWEGGLVYYGGFIAGAIAVVAYVFSHRELRLWRLADIVAPALALGHVFGRIGCFFAGCCYGAQCTLPWAVTFSNPESFAPAGVSRHPTQLYEAFGNLVIFILLDRYNRSTHREGLAFAVYLVFYGVLRFCVEFLRADERGAFVLGMSPGQAISIIAMAAGIVIFIARRKNETAA